MFSTPIYERNNRGNRMSKLNFFKRIAATKYLVLGIAVMAVVAGYVGTHAYATKQAGKRSNCSDTCVSIRPDGFSQSELAVKVGTFVEFRSADGRTHNLALGEGTEHDSSDNHTEPAQASVDHPHDHVSGTESGEFGADEAWKVQFKKAGTYVIHDHLHPELNILVVVYETRVN
jgi:plastocyanin